MQNLRPTSLSREPLRFITQRMCMGKIWCRSYARADGVYISDDFIKKIVATAREIESGTIFTNFTAYSDVRVKK